MLNLFLQSPINVKTDVDFKAKLSQALYFIRGIAIFLVVVGHVIGQNKETGIRQLYNSDIFSLSWLANFIYTFHMAVFFIASGVAFMVFSNKNASYLEFFRSKLKRLFIPLVFWVPPFFVLQSLSKGKSFDLFDIIDAIIYPYSIFWFIHALIFAVSFAFICFKVFKSKLIYILLSLIIFAISLRFRNIIIYNNIFYTLGVFIACYLPKIRLILEKLQVNFIFIILFAGFSIMLITNYLMQVNHEVFVNIINGTIGFFLIYTMAVIGKKIVSFKQLSKLLHSVKANFLYLGKISMVIYVFHIYFLTATRVFLVRFFGITQPSLQLVLGCLAATLGPVIVYKLLQTRSKVFRYSLGES